MQRRIKAQPHNIAPYQALIDHKEATLNVLLSRIPDVSTFAHLAELIGYSHEWVRQRLIQAPEKLYKNGALRENLNGGPFYAAFLKTTNSVRVAAIRWAFSSR